MVVGASLSEQRIADLMSWHTNHVWVLLMTGSECMVECWNFENCSTWPIMLKIWKDSLQGLKILVFKQDTSSQDHSPDPSSRGHKALESRPVIGKNIKVFRSSIVSINDWTLKGLVREANLLCIWWCICWDQIWYVSLFGHRNVTFVSCPGEPGDDFNAWRVNSVGSLSPFDLLNCLGVLPGTTAKMSLR